LAFYRNGDEPVMDGHAVDDIAIGRHVHVGHLGWVGRVLDVLDVQTTVAAVDDEEALRRWIVRDDFRGAEIEGWTT